LPTNAEGSGGGVILSALIELGYLLDYYTTIDDEYVKSEGQLE